MTHILSQQQIVQTVRAHKVEDLAEYLKNNIELVPEKASIKVGNDNFKDPKIT